MTRIYVSKYLGHGVRVGVPVNLTGILTERPAKPHPGKTIAMTWALMLLNGVALVTFPPLLLVTLPALVFWIVYANRRYDRKAAAAQAKVKAVLDEAETVRAASANLTAQDRAWLVENGWTPPV